VRLVCQVRGMSHGALASSRADAPWLSSRTPCRLLSVETQKMGPPSLPSPAGWGSPEVEAGLAVTGQCKELTALKPKLVSCCPLVS
jgi:hypothetical protein